MMHQPQTKENATQPQTFTKVYEQWANSQQKPTHPQLATLAQRWITDEARGFVRSSTLSNYLNHLKHITKHLGSLNITQLDKTTVNNFLLTLHNTENLSCGTIKSIASTLSSICRYGQENHLITKNPCKRLKMPTEHQAEAKVFSRTQQTRLEQTILKGKDPREIGILICLYTGIRLGELCALKWENFNARQKTLHIAKSISRVKLFDNSPTKTQIMECNPKTKKSNRVIPLPTFLSELLQTLKKTSTGKYIIPSKNDPTKPLQPRTMQNVFKRLLTRANLPNTNFHALRHTFATRSIELGADIKSLSEILGHSNTSTTMNRYAHSFMEYKRKLMHKINSISIQKKPHTHGGKGKKCNQFYAV